MGPVALDEFEVRFAHEREEGDLVQDRVEPQTFCIDAEIAHVVVCAGVVGRRKAELELLRGLQVEGREEGEVLGRQVGAVLSEEGELRSGYADVFELCVQCQRRSRLGGGKGCILSTCVCSHVNARRLSFFSGVRLVKLYVTCTSGKNLSTQHCMVSLYRSVSSRDVMPSGGFATAVAMLCSWLCEEGTRLVGE